MGAAATSAPVPRRKGSSILAWVLQILAGLAFVAAGIPKFIGSADVVAGFETIGFGQWFRYLTGTLEVLGGLGLMLPRFAFYAALVLACVMVGAIITHLTLLPGSPIPALVLLIVLGVIAWLRRPQASV